MGYDIFMTFVKFLKLSWISEVIVKKIHINYKRYLQTSILLLCINHNEQHIGKWKSSIILKLIFFTIPCNKC